MKLNIKKYLILSPLLIGFLLTIVGTGYQALGEVPSSEPRIASMELNRSAGNMTGDDYMIALMFDYIDYKVKDQGLQWSESEELRKKYEDRVKEADRKFPEYDFLPMFYYDVSSFCPLYSMMNNAANRSLQEFDEYGYGGGTIIYEYPSQHLIDIAVYKMFTKGVSDGVCLQFNEGGQVDAAREAVQMRLAEEAHQKALQREKDEQRRALQLEGENRQRALDTHYKGLFENYSRNLTSILNSSLNESDLNESDLNNALNLSNEAIEALVSPHRNVMMINRGDIYTRMGRYEDAIENYNRAKTDFTYSNDSADYQNKLRQDFEQDKWGRIADMKIGIANQKISEQIYAKIHDLRDAPDVKQLLSGHVNGKNYSANVENHTYAGNGYQVYINLSGSSTRMPTSDDISINPEIDPDVAIFKDIPIYIDMFSALFKDERISKVHIRINDTYFDKFGHELEKPLMDITLDNETAMQIGDWSDFKDYIGTDMYKFGEVADMEYVED
jgi:tetratricopeptide (TPR) repeat protein